MRILRVAISKIFRLLGWISALDKLLYFSERVKNRRSNRIFKGEYPNINLPPTYMVYEAFRLDYYRYYFGGEATARIIAGYSEELTLKEGRKILEWGCGPGRIIRHMPSCMRGSDLFYGTDTNKKTIEWCSENLPGIHFSHNSIQGTLPFENGFFDMIFGVSILTHLSQEMHHFWIKEVTRVLKDDGILILTTQGEAFRPKLTNRERAHFDKGYLVVRDRAEVGHRTFSAFQPPEYMRELLVDFNRVEHVEPTVTEADKYPQDFWVISKAV